MWDSCQLCGVTGRRESHAAGHATRIAGYDDTTARALDDTTARALAHLENASNVIVLSGAGMSTAAGIPDFRSPGGLYGNSAMLLDRFTYLDRGGLESTSSQKQMLSRDVKSALTYRYFRENPLTYHEMRRGFILGLGAGQWKPTLGHLFPEILNRNGKLRLLASQNIDGLDHRVVSDKRKLYNPHGLMSTLVAEPSQEPLCTDPRDPIYQRYAELVKTHVKDIYADLPPRQGKSSHLWPGPEQSVPITLEMFGDDLPRSFHGQRDRERAEGSFSVKPGSVMFDMKLWTTNAAGEFCDAFGEVQNCDLMLVMGTSLSGLTIDNMAHKASDMGKPIVVFDMTAAPVESIREKGGWDDSRDCLLQGSIDQSLVQLLHSMGWLEQVYDFLPHLCVTSLKVLRQFVKGSVPGSGARLEQIDQAIASEVEREKTFYGD